MKRIEGRRECMGKARTALPLGRSLVLLLAIAALRTSLGSMPMCAMEACDPVASFEPAHAQAQEASTPVPAASGEDPGTQAQAQAPGAAFAIYLPRTLHEAPAPLRPVPTVLPDPYPSRDGLEGCIVVMRHELRVDGTVIRTTTETQHGPEGERLHGVTWDESRRLRTVWRNHYDAAGKLERSVNEWSSSDPTSRGGSRTVYLYDPEGRLHRVQHYVDGSPTSLDRFVHDERGDLVRELRGLAPDGRWVYNTRIRHMTYDDQGRRLRETLIDRKTGEAWGEFLYEWDGTRLQEMRYRPVQGGLPGADVWAKRYHYAAGRLARSESTRAEHGWEGPSYREYDYDDAGRLIREHFVGRDGEREPFAEYDYDADGRLRESRYLQGPPGELRSRTRYYHRCGP